MTYKVRVGDDILYHPSQLDKKDGKMTHHDSSPLGAHCSYVWSDTLVNLSVFDHEGHNHGRTSVPFWDGSGTCPFIGSESAWCEPNTRQNTEAAAHASGKDAADSQSESVSAEAEVDPEAGED